MRRAELREERMSAILDHHADPAPTVVGYAFDRGLREAKIVNDKDDAGAIAQPVFKIPFSIVSPSRRR